MSLSEDGLIGNPSMMISGSLLEFTEAAPLILKVAPAPGFALPMLTSRPAAFPARIFVTDVTDETFPSSTFMDETAPVRSDFFMVP